MRTLTTLIIRHIRNRGLNFVSCNELVYNYVQTVETVTSVVLLFTADRKQSVTNGKCLTYSSPETRLDCLWGPLNCLSSGYCTILSRNKRPGLEPVYSHLYSVKVKNAWSFTCAVVVN